MAAIRIIDGDGGVLAIEGVLEYTLESSADATEHPVERGAEIVDHVQVKAKRLRFRGQVTESPFARVSRSGGQARVARAREFLDRCAGTLVTVVTDVLGTFENMTMVRWPVKRGTFRRIDLDLEFRQVRLAEAGLVSIPPEAPSTSSAAAGLPDEQDVGEQPTTSSSAEPEQEAADQSALLDLTEAMGVTP